MGALGTHFSGVLSLLMLPTNLAVLLGGVLAGLLGARLMMRAGLDGAGVIALLFPIAVMLDPATSVILLGSAWAAGLAAAETRERTWRAVAAMAAILACLLLVVGPAAPLLPKLAPAEKVALLVAAAALSIIAAARGRLAIWRAAMALTVLGVAIELSPLQPLDATKASPRAVLLGLLTIGPALLMLLRPQAINAADGSLSTAENSSTTVLPLLLFAMPVTARTALLTLALGEHGLTAGQTLITQRPRLALSFALALILALIAAVLIVVVGQRLPRPLWLPTFDRDVGTRACAVAVLLLSGVLLLMLGVERGELTVLAMAALVGGVLHGFGFSTAPLIIGLTIGEIMRPLLAPAAQAGIADGRSGFIVIISALAILSAMVWPWLLRTKHAKLA